MEQIWRIRGAASRQMVVLVAVAAQGCGGRSATGTPGDHGDAGDSAVSPPSDASNAADAPVGDSAVDAAMDGSTGGCLATLLPDGACDYCPFGACPNGTCISGNGDYSCQCSAGYTPYGRTCVADDQCKAQGGACIFPGYPCENTALPGHACLGEFAAWPVTDRAARAPSRQPSFQDNGDGTLTDLVTKLGWQVSAASSGPCALAPDDAALGASDAAASTGCGFDDAKSYCAALALGGHDDWRLPTKVELESLIDYSQAQPPYVYPAFLSPGANTGTCAAVGGCNAFWTVSLVVGAPNGVTTPHWFVDFSRNDLTSGFVVAGPQFSATVRCVRGTGIGPTTAAVHYTIHAGVLEAGTDDADTAADTVSDNWTGLTWQRSSSGVLLYSDALAYCQRLGGFRLPTAKELLTLVDPVAYNASIDYGTFGYSSDDSAYWSSTPELPPNGDYVGVLFDYGETAKVSAGESHYARCVR